MSKEEARKKNESLTNSETSEIMKKIVELAEKSLKGADSEDPFEIYTDTIKSRIYGNRGKFQRRFISGYEVLLEALKDFGPHKR